MKKYEVTCTRIYNGTLFVEAESKEEAMRIAEESEDISWQFGEETVDYAEELNEWQKEMLQKEEQL